MAVAVYIVSMVGAIYIGYTGETLRGLELFGFIILFPVASLLLGFYLSDQRILWLPMVVSAVTFVPMLALTALTGIQKPDAQGGFLFIEMAVGGALCIWIGQYARDFIKGHFGDGKWS